MLTPESQRIVKAHTVQPFGTLPDGRTVHRYSLTNAMGWQVDVLDWGGIISALHIPDCTGSTGDVVLGFDDLQGYLTGNAYIGALIGRYGNRIARGRFELDGQLIELATNDGTNHLHGGETGFDRRLWIAELVDTDRGPAILLTYSSPHGEEGYPGTLDVAVRYLWTDEGSLEIEYRAQTDRPTVVNLTQHTYFNLTGRQGTSILDHEISLKASRLTPVDARLIPTGDLADVSGSVFDFLAPHRLGERIEHPDEQLQRAGGYDHNFVVDGEPGSLRPAAWVHDPESGRTMTVRTTEPGIQLYSGNFLDGLQIGKGGAAYGKRTGLCLETQHFPDSPNQQGFPSAKLIPGKEYVSKTVFSFAVEQ